MLETMPLLLVGAAMLAFATSRPEQALWLTAAERQAVAAGLAEGTPAAASHNGLRSFLLDRCMWRLAAIYLTDLVGLYGLSFWLPTVIRASGVRHVSTIGWLCAIPYVVAVPVIVLSGVTVDRTAWGLLHFAGFLLLGAFAFALSGLSLLGPAGAAALLSLAAIGILSVLSLFWGVPATLLAGRSATISIALINAVGNLAGLLSPATVGWLNVHTGGQQAGLLAVAGLIVAGSLVVWSVPAAAERRRSRRLGETTETRTGKHLT